LKIGLYGGTFDPIHNGHLRVIVELISRKIVDKILVIPAGQPQLREQSPVADGDSRLKMCELAISDLPSAVKDSVSIDAIEIERTGPSFAIDTVEALISKAKSHSNVPNEYFWIIGSDAYQKIDNWHRASELKELVSFIVIDRPSPPEKVAEEPREELLDIDALDISATKIRSDSSLQGVSPSVRKYIMERKLYASK